LAKHVKNKHSESNEILEVQGEKKFGRPVKDHFLETYKEAELQKKREEKRMAKE
jgi:hypothetical protein